MSDEIAKSGRGSYAQVDDLDAFGFYEVQVESHNLIRVIETWAKPKPEEERRFLSRATSGSACAEAPRVHAISAASTLTTFRVRVNVCPIPHNRAG